MIKNDKKARKTKSLRIRSYLTLSFTVVVTISYGDILGLISELIKEFCLDWAITYTKDTSRA